MAKILSHRFVLRQNGIEFSSYQTYGRALIALEEYLKRGVFLPYDTLTIFDRQTNLFVYIYNYV